MKHQSPASARVLKLPVTAGPLTLAAATQSPDRHAPSADEVAGRAYQSYLNQGSQPGHEERHWLEAEAQLLAERRHAEVQMFHRLN